LPRGARLVTVSLLAATVVLGNLVPRVPEDALEAVVCAVGAVAAAFRRRFGVVGGDWCLANLVVGGHLVSTNTDPPWTGA
jgi:hypothetical protein